jgi:polyhydroxyalkanoate synthesis regulator phasin
MVLDGLRGYIQLANGLTDVTRARALAAAKALVAQGEAGVGAVVPTPVRAQVGAITDDLLATGRANRALLVNLVRTEVERSVSRMGLVSAQELDAANRRSRALERRVDEIEQEVRRPGRRRTAKTSAGRKATTKKSTAKKSSAKKSTASETTASTAAAGSTPESSS